MLVAIDVRPLHQIGSSHRGIGRYLYNLVNSLLKFNGGPSFLFLVHKGKNAVLDLEGLSTSARWKFLPLIRPERKIVPLYWFLDRLLLSSALVKEGIDLFHATGFSEPYFATVAPSPHYGTVLTVYDLIPWLFPTEYYRTFQARLVRGYLYRLRLRAVKEADKIIVPSEASKRDLLALMKVSRHKVIPIHHGLPKGLAPISDETQIGKVLAKYGIPQEYILYLGGLDYRKNLGRLMQAYASLLISRLWDGYLVIAGTGVKREVAKVRQMIQGLGLQGRILLPGFIADEDLPTLYSGAKVFVFPSLYEGFGLPALEAMACGTPVVTSNLSALPEVVGEAAIQVEPYDVQALAEAIAEVLKSERLRNEMRAKGLARVKSFSLEEEARKTLSIYEEVGKEHQLAGG
ncbi:MAG: glycosyltransferase family 4 protein [Anaerolineae bacterium]